MKVTFISQIVSSGRFARSVNDFFRRFVHSERNKCVAHPLRESAGRDEVLRLNPNRRRILESILFLIKEAESAGDYLTQYEIVKSIFIADTMHLEEYGRPVSFDNYVAMRFGPVPSEAFDMLKPEYPGDRHMGEAWPIWVREPSPRDGQNAFRYVRPSREPNLRVLSKTDQTALKAALDTVKSLKFGGTRDLTHQHPAYKDAWRDDGGRAAYDMKYRLLLATQDDEDAAEIAHASKYA